jgi:3-keto-disaccharide hydrolase
MASALRTTRPARFAWESTRCNQDGRGLGLLFYALQPFENFVLRLDFLLPHPRGADNDNSGVFVRFRDPRLPDPAPDPVDPANNSAFVAMHTGFEAQIDEEARGEITRTWLLACGTAMKSR